MSLTTNFHLWIRGVWIPLPDVEADVTKSFARGRSSWTSLGGVRREQYVPRANATWQVSYGRRGADAWRLLSYAASGRAGSVWLYDVQAAQANMLGEAATQGTSSTTIAVDGIPMPAFLASATSTVKLRNGVAYHLSYWTTATSGTTVGTYKIGASSAVNVVAPSGTGVRRGSVSFVPSSDADVVLTWTVADKTSGAMLSESSITTSGFLPGEHSPCQVVVSDRSQRLNWVFSDKLSYSDVAFEIREVG